MGKFRIFTLVCSSSSMTNLFGFFLDFVEEDDEDG